MAPVLKAQRADITTLAVDVIVNAANSSLLGGCKTGEAKLTRGYRLPACHIVHTVGPVWRGGAHGEPELLPACYRNSLSLAAAQGAATVAFPSISTGIYGDSIEKAARVAVETVLEAAAQHGSLQEIVFCCFSAKDLSVYEDALAHCAE